VLRLAQVDLYAADRVADAVEAEQVDLHEVVDGQPGEVLDRADEQAGTGGLAAVVVDDAVGIRGVQLAHAVARDGHVRVTRERDHRGLGAVRRKVHHHHRVRVVATAVARGADRRQFLVGGGVAVVVADDEQVLVLAVDVLGRLARIGDRVDPADVRLEVVVGPPGPSAGGDDAEREQRGQGARDQRPVLDLVPGVGRIARLRRGPLFRSGGTAPTRVQFGGQWRARPAVV
jgi:hypothetical protein